MALSYKARKRLSLLALLVAMPAYIVVAVTLVNLFERPPILLELGIYVVLGIIWILPLKPIFRGVGQADPDVGDDTSDR
jgi:predicted membrane channel-forming protein YqfA (hemolysin III family)